MDHLKPTPLWTLVANIKENIRHGEEKLQTRIGTKQFSAGTKVYIIDWFAGMCKDITVIGLSRDTKRLITIVIRAEWVENLRVKLCYTPTVCSTITAYFDKEESGMQRYTERFVKEMFIGIPQWNEPESI
ncbi:hypothetical protein [Sphingobacterium sp. 2149]|uniref:hypothetical protein n=1 Tax=Sphingobacterium sp. 2149 TaxID=2817763 RepID=UPI002861B1AC|nr:hypothetical protein [Sphingobacterium sp. 2149]MDR6734881.1 hypothetical protein [Sphingobacterium sp. 2149]